MCTTGAGKMYVGRQKIVQRNVKPLENIGEKSAGMKEWKFELGENEMQTNKKLSRYRFCFDGSTCARKWTYQKQIIARWIEIVPLHRLGLGLYATWINIMEKPLQWSPCVTYIVFILKSRDHHHRTVCQFEYFLIKLCALFFSLVFSFSLSPHRSVR